MNRIAFALLAIPLLLAGCGGSSNASDPPYQIAAVGSVVSTASTCALTAEQKATLTSLNSASGYSVQDIGKDGARYREDRAALIVYTGSQIASGLAGGPLLIPACAYDEAKPLLPPKP